MRLGVVRYLNTTPLIEGLEKLSGLTLRAAVPAKLFGMLRAGEVDLALASVIDAAGPGADVVLVSAGMIGCDGPTLTVRLYSATPFERVTRLHADTDSHTSVVLARVVLARRFGVTPEVVDFDARERVAVSPVSGGEEWPETLLLIGDKVVADPPPAERYPHQLDLGEQWRELTGLPFVYAVWMCRARDLEDAERAEAIRSAAVLLDRQVRHNATRLDWLVNRRAAEHRWPAEEARRYLAELLRYRVGPREREAVAEFLRSAASIGAAGPASVRWLELSREGPGSREAAELNGVTESRGAAV